MHLIAQGRHRQLADCLEAHVVTLQGVAGTRFAVWAPNARRVAVVGDFNEWDGRKHPMRLRRECGVWEVFGPGVRAASLLKFEFQDTYRELLAFKADALARHTEIPPAPSANR